MSGVQGPLIHKTKEKGDNTTTTQAQSASLAKNGEGKHPKNSTPKNTLFFPPFSSYFNIYFYSHLHWFANSFCFD